MVTSSMRIQGLEQGINDNAYSRDVVFLWCVRYAGADVAKARGMLVGRSWGCMAVGEDTIKPLVDTIKKIIRWLLLTIQTQRG